MMNKLLDCLLLVELIIFWVVIESWNYLGAMKNADEMKIDLRGIIGDEQPKYFSQKFRFFYEWGLVETQ